MKKKMILFVCVANYCRSPVAERLFNYKNTSEYYAESAGLIQFKQTSMENRSKKHKIGERVLPWKYHYTPQSEWICGSNVKYVVLFDYFEHDMDFSCLKIDSKLKIV